MDGAEGVRGVDRQQQVDWDCLEGWALSWRVAGPRGGGTVQAGQWMTSWTGTDHEC